jgi:alkylation response protein AidB-like acyl-CoA dehydrogenase
MDFSFSDEQRQLADTLRRYLDKDYRFEARQRIVHSDAGVSADQWRALAELGLTALPVPAEHDGFNGSTFDMLVVMQELGRALVVEPYWATAVGVEALRLASLQLDAGGAQTPIGASGETIATILQRVATGDAKLAVAFGEPQARHDLFDIETVATMQSDAYTLSGCKSIVVHGAQADWWIVPARLDGEVALFMVPCGSSGVDVVDYRTIDGMRAANLTLSSAHAQRLGGSRFGAHSLERVADYAITLLCAEAMGILDAVMHATVEYTKSRQQFGVPIARFQALQHRMVEMLIHTEQARSITYLAAARYDSPDSNERRRAVSAAKARVGQAARFVGQQAIQLHGGMGVTNEVAAAHLFKRLTIIDVALGDVDHHLARFASLPGFATSEV